MMFIRNNILIFKYLNRLQYGLCHKLLIIIKYTRIYDIS